MHMGLDIKTVLCVCRIISSVPKRIQKVEIGDPGSAGPSHWAPSRDKDMTRLDEDIDPWVDLA